jgi:hypothetical protein
MAQEADVVNEKKHCKVGQGMARLTLDATAEDFVCLKTLHRRPNNPTRKSCSKVAVPTLAFNGYAPSSLCPWLALPPTLPPPLKQRASWSPVSLPHRPQQYKTTSRPSPPSLSLLSPPPPPSPHGRTSRDSWPFS